MGKLIRTCGSENPMVTGAAKCPITPQYIKALILTHHGVKLPADITAEEIEKACHADYPNRIYPITHIAEYAPSGGEVKTSQTGYGPNTVVGYSDTTDQFTLYDSDVQRRASIIKNMNTAFDVYYVDENGVIYGVSDEKEGEFPLKGFPLTGIGLGGQMFRTSGAAASDVLTLYTRDYAMYAKDFMSVPVDFNIVDTLEISGIRLVEWVKDGENAWTLIDKYAKSDVTGYFGATMASKANTVFTNASAASFADGKMTITLNSGTVPQLAKPSVLQAAGIIGIEQL